MMSLRIGRIMTDGRPTVVVERDGRAAPLPGVEMKDLLSDWARWRPQLEALDAQLFTLDPELQHWLPPVEPNNLICVGTNYADHVAEMAASGGPLTKPSPWPFSFLKPPTSALVGHGSHVARPRYARKLDWEVELAVIIGDPTKLTGPNPMEGVFGYSVINDLSVRDFVPLPHSLGMDAVVMKGFDGSAPMGPWIRPADEVADPQNLRLRLSVNGELKQDGNTGNMIFSVLELLEHFSLVMTLHPGDVIATGTPSGVGMGRHPQEFLGSGDVVEATIDGIGVLRTSITEPTGPDVQLMP